MHRAHGYRIVIGHTAHIAREGGTLKAAVRELGRGSDLAPHDEGSLRGLNIPLALLGGIEPFLFSKLSWDMSNKLQTPKAIGATITIAATESDKLRKLQGEGFFVEVVTPRQITLRRDYADGTLKTK